MLFLFCIPNAKNGMSVMISRIGFVSLSFHFFYLFTIYKP